MMCGLPAHQVKPSTTVVTGLESLVATVVGGVGCSLAAATAVEVAQRAWAADSHPTEYCIGLTIVTALKVH